MSWLMFKRCLLGSLATLRSHLGLLKSLWASSSSVSACTRIWLCEALRTGTRFSLHCPWAPHFSSLLTCKCMPICLPRRNESGFSLSFSSWGVLKRPHPPGDTIRRHVPSKFDWSDVNVSLHFDDGLLCICSPLGLGAFHDDRQLWLHCHRCVMLRRPASTRAV